MFRKYYIGLIILFLFTSCANIQFKFDKLEENDSEKSDDNAVKTEDAIKETRISTIPRSKGDSDALNWDIGSLDTARSIKYLSEVEKDVILEMNKVRTDPKKFAELYIKPLLKYYRGNKFIEGNSMPILTQEGISAVEECYAVLKKSVSSGILFPEKGLSLAALDHVKDQNVSGATGHSGKDGSSPLSRTQRYGRGMKIGENIAYGPYSGRKIVSELLIDDGVPSRGHRENILRQDFSQTGVSIGNHKKYRIVCVIVYAKDYVSK